MVGLLAGKPEPAIARKVGPFPHRLLVVRGAGTSAPVLLRVTERNTAEVQNEKIVAGLLSDYVSYFPDALEPYRVPFKKCREAVDAWRHQRVDLTELPKPVAFASDPELAMARLDFDPKPVDRDALKLEAPHFARILERLTNAEAFCMRVGSFYDVKADRKQACWISGPGDTGKSVLPWLIDELLPGGTTSLSPSLIEKTSFWIAKLVGKRVAHVKEAAAKFIRTSEFKSITGDSVHAINEKNQPMFDARIDALLFFYSNEAPEIPRDDALMKRVIDCRMGKIPASEPVMSDDDIRERLRPELPLIAGYCLNRYMELPRGGRIPCSGLTLEDSVTQYEADYLAFLEEHLIEATGDPAAYLTRTRFREMMREWGFVSSKDQSICKRVLLSNFRVTERKHDFETNAPGIPKRLYVYEGVRERSDKERQFAKRSSDGSNVRRPVNQSHLQVVEQP